MLLKVHSIVQDAQNDHPPLGLDDAKGDDVPPTLTTTSDVKQFRFVEAPNERLIRARAKLTKRGSKDAGVSLRLPHAKARGRPADDLIEVALRRPSQDHLPSALTRHRFLDCLSIARSVSMLR